MAKSFREQHDEGQQGLSETTRRMVRLLPRVFTEEQSEAIHRCRVELGERTGAVRALKKKKSQGVDQLVAEAYWNLGLPQLDGLAGRVTEAFGTGELPVKWGGQGAAPVQERGSAQAGELKAHMLCRHGGQDGVDGGLREETVEAVCSRVHTGQHEGVRAGQVHTGSKLLISPVPG